MNSKLRATGACALPDSEMTYFAPHLNQVTLNSGKGVVSLAADTHDHGQVEVGLTDREGLGSPGSTSPAGGAGSGLG